MYNYRQYTNVAESNDTVERFLKNMTRKGRPLANGSDRRRLLTLWPPPIHIIMYTHTHTPHVHTHA